MALTPRQQLALNRSTSRINLWYGSVRSSKTYAQVHDFIARMTMWTGDGVNLVIGHSTNTVWRNIFQPIVTRPEFKAVAPYLRYRQNAPTGTLFGKPFNVVGASNEASWLAIQGLTVENAWGDEAAGWPLSFWDMLISRLSLPQSRLLATCNPSTANHYLKGKVVDKQHTDPDVHVEKFLLHENTTLSRNYIDMVARQYSGLFYRRMILAEWVAAEGAVYEGWDPDTMVVDELPELLQTVSFGVDYGTTHPTAGHALSIGRSVETGRLCTACICTASSTRTPGSDAPPICGWPTSCRPTSRHCRTSRATCTPTQPPPHSGRNYTPVVCSHTGRTITWWTASALSTRCL